LKKEKSSNVIIKEAETKIKIPLDVQKRMLEFFMRTSIPRNKKNKKLLSENKKG